MARTWNSRPATTIEVTNSPSKPAWSIYHHATFTIIASAASSMKEGFSSPRQAAGAGENGVPVFDIKYIDERPGASYESKIITLLSLEMGDSELWLERAWTLSKAYDLGDVYISAHDRQCGTAIEEASHTKTVPVGLPSRPSETWDTFSFGCPRHAQGRHASQRASNLSIARLVLPSRWYEQPSRIQAIPEGLILVEQDSGDYSRGGAFSMISSIWG